MSPPYQLNPLSSVLVRSVSLVRLLALSSAVVACDGAGPEVGTSAAEESPRAAARGRVVRSDRADLPLFGATPEEVERFDAGDLLFELAYRPADGLGPLYIRASCVACHAGDARGPGRVSRVALTELARPVAGGSPLADTLRPYVVAPATQPVTALEHPGLRLTQRLPPAVFGRGYLEAVADSEIERLERAAQARTGSARGRIHRVTYRSEPNPASPFHAYRNGQSGLIGRFGLKAKLASLDELVADAFQGDMGLTSPLRPHELPNPEGLLDDERPGPDIELELLNTVTDYVRLLELPRRPPEGTDAARRGSALFKAVGCAVCHVPSLRTRADYPIAALADLDALVYTDLLLHDMGAALSDGVSEGDAAPAEWRTAPLIGLRFAAALMHDGRARDVEEAITAHAGPGSEASDCIDAFEALAPAERAALIGFVEGL